MVKRAIIHVPLLGLCYIKELKKLPKEQGIQLTPLQEKHVVLHSHVKNNCVLVIATEFETVAYVQRFYGNNWMVVLDIPTEVYRNITDQLDEEEPIGEHSGTFGCPTKYQYN
jgi:hypothetical protein